MTMRIAALILAGLAAALSHKWAAILQPAGDSIVTGSAVVEETGGDSLRAEILVAGARPGSVVPWHIHLGSCGNNETILRVQGEYPALKAGSDGKASAGVTLAGQLPGGGEYSVVVHKSGSDMTPSACGGLKATGGIQ